MNFHTFRNPAVIDPFRPAQQRPKYSTKQDRTGEIKFDQIYLYMHILVIPLPGHNGFM